MHVIETGLVAGLAQLTRALEARKAELLAELRKLEHDIEAAQRTVDVAARVGFRIPPAAPPPTGRPASEPVRPVATQPLARPEAPWASPDVAPTQAPQSTEDSMLAYARTLESLKTLQPNTSLMSAAPRAEDGLRLAVADVPKDGPKLDAMRDSVAGIAEKAAAAPPGPGGRRHMSKKSLVPGEPMSPAIVNILKAADRPLGSAEVAVAMLQARGLDYRGKQLTAVVSRVSAILGQLVKKRRVRRITVEGERDRKWSLREPA